MLMQAMIDECDFTDRKYDTPVEGAWLILQGATGRWCPVMYAGPEYLADSKQPVLTYEEVMAEIENKGGWPDGCLL